RCLVATELPPGRQAVDDVVFQFLQEEGGRAHGLREIGAGELKAREPMEFGFVARARRGCCPVIRFVHAPMPPIVSSRSKPDPIAA
ncbi:hypothetical protein CEE86_12280, partial [Lactobacillus crispatus]